jgi:hypothetical protein
MIETKRTFLIDYRHFEIIRCILQHRYRRPRGSTTLRL